jgi:hypothetical protein
MRYVILDQKYGARDAAFAGALTLVCPVTGEDIRAEDCYMDHDARTFVELADAFAAEIGSYDSIATTSVDGDIGGGSLTRRCRYVGRGTTQRMRGFDRSAVGRT